MANPRHLARAPIEEAIVDFDVAFRVAPTPAAFASLRKRLAAKYPISEERRSFIDEEGAVAHAAGDAHGYILKSQDLLNVVQVRADGFSVNRLAPYTDWDHLRTEAVSVWDVFSEVCSPERLERVALRYLNRMKIPPRGVLTDFLEVSPPQFPGAPANTAKFLLRMENLDPVAAYATVVVQALDYTADYANAILILDIDAYTVGGVSMESREALLEALEQLHTAKNAIFFGSITEKTAELFE